MKTQFILWLLAIIFSGFVASTETEDCGIISVKEDIRTKLVHLLEPFKEYFSEMPHFFMAIIAITFKGASSIGTASVGITVV